MSRFLARAATTAALGALALVTAALTPDAGAAQAIAVDPHIVVLGPSVRSSGFTVMNPGKVPVEVAVGFVYGYAGSDSVGNGTVFFPREPDASEPNAAPWLSAFPRRMVIAPGGMQEVRFRADPPAQLAEGEYWARVILTSRAATPALDQRPTVEVQATLKLEMNTILPLFYRTAGAKTSADIRGLSVRLARADVAKADTTKRPLRDTLHVAADIAREGNAAYLGMARLALTDAKGVTVAQASYPHAVYRATTPRWHVPVPPSLPRGAYTLTLTLDTQRADVPASTVLLASPVRKSASFVVE